MRIILHDYGGYSFTSQLAKAWAESGHEVYFIYSDTTQFVQRSQFERKIRGLIIKGIKLTKPFHKYSFFERRKSEIEHGILVAKEINTFHPNLVISANTPLDSQKYILKECKKIGSRFVFWFQDAISVAIRRTLRQKFRLFGDLIGAYYEYKEGHLLRSSDKVILISKDFLSLMKRWGIYKQNIHIIPNWASIEDIPIEPKQNTWAEKHNLANNFCFLFTGIMGIKHNPDIFIYLAKYFSDYNDVRVVIISEGGKVDELKVKSIEKELTNLIVLPFQPKRDYSQVLGSADVLVSVLNQDAGSYSIPSKVLTYCCAARPLLLSVPKENEAAKIISNAEIGLVSSPDDINEFLRDAKLLYENESLRLKMGIRARKYAENMFDIKRILLKFEPILKVQ